MFSGVTCAANATSQTGGGNGLGEGFGLSWLLRRALAEGWA